MDIAGIFFDPPEHARASETVVTFELPVPPDDAARLRPNLIVRSRALPPAHGLIDAAGELCAELRHLGSAVGDLSHGEIVFADEVRGMMVAYDFVRGARTIRQYHALRVDDGRLTTLVLTVGAELDPTLQRAYLQSLSSARRNPQPTEV